MAMNETPSCDISVAITGSGGAGSITAGELLLGMAGNNGCFGMMRRSFGPQIRGGEAAALVRFAGEITGHSDSLIIADPASEDVPARIRELGYRIVEVPMKALAGEIEAGRPNMVALGLLCQWLGFSPDEAGRSIDHVFHDKGEVIVKGSRAAFDKGFTEPSIVAARAARPRSERPGPSWSGARWDVSGNEACGLGALRGGIRFAAAYPITPASDLLEWLSPRLEKLGGQLLQAEDELASINMVIGASFGGVPAMTATSGPGLALMLEGIGLAVASETPAVIVNVMRGAGPCGLHPDDRMVRQAGRGPADGRRGADRPVPGPVQGADSGTPLHAAGNTGPTYCRARRGLPALRGYAQRHFADGKSRNGPVHLRG
jgi:2-oxoglutarate ferredoxin oxidoreductase subunit alpha